MSGGSWEYLHVKVEEAASRLSDSAIPERRTFGKHLHLCATALFAIEWVDSCDWGKGDDLEPIQAVFKSAEKPWPARNMEELLQDVKQLQDNLQAAVADLEQRLQDASPPTSGE